MFLRIGFLCIVMLITPFTLLSQDISFCKGVTPTGRPIDISNTFSFRQSGSGYVYCLISSSSPLTQTCYLLKIDKNSNGTYTPYKSEFIRAGANQNSAGIDLLFTEAGTYKCSLFDGSRTFTSSVVTINSIGDGSNSLSPFNNANYNDPHSTFYFVDSDIAFCDSVDENGNPLNKSSIFTLGGNGGKVIALLTNKNKPFKTNSLIVKMYAKKGKDFTASAGENKYSIDPDSPYAIFPIRFTQKGEYRLNVFTADNVFIIDGYVTIK